MGSDIGASVSRPVRGVSRVVEWKHSDKLVIVTPRKRDSTLGIAVAPMEAVSVAYQAVAAEPALQFRELLSVAPTSENTCETIRTGAVN